MDNYWPNVVTLIVTAFFAWLGNKQIADLKSQNREQQMLLEMHDKELVMCREEHKNTKNELVETRQALAIKTANEHNALQSQIDELKKKESNGGAH